MPYWYTSMYMFTHYIYIHVYVNSICTCTIYTVLRTCINVLYKEACTCTHTYTCIRTYWNIHWCLHIPWCIRVYWEIFIYHVFNHIFLVYSAPKFLYITCSIIYSWYILHRSPIHWSFNMRVRMWLYICIGDYMYLCACVCMCVNLYMPMHTHTYVCIYLYMYI